MDEQAGGSHEAGIGVADFKTGGEEEQARRQQERGAGQEERALNVAWCGAARGTMRRNPHILRAKAGIEPPQSSKTLGRNVENLVKDGQFLAKRWLIAKIYGTNSQEHAGPVPFHSRSRSWP